MKRLIAALAVVIIGGAAPKPVDPAPVVAAERAFAADGAAMGVGPSFLKHSANEAIMIGPAGVTTPTAAFPPPTGLEGNGLQPKLAWWPLWAGIAQSGDLGFTTGPVEVGGTRQGYYFTVWKRQAGGGWKWIYDGGAGASSVGEPGEATAAMYLPVSTARAMAPDKAMDQVRAAEGALAGVARADQKKAFAAVLSEGARMYVAPRPAAVGKAAVLEALGVYPAAMEFGSVGGGEASKAGDLAYVYGPVSWTGGRGMYVHLWQRRTDGWKLVFGQIVPGR